MRRRPSPATLPATLLALALPAAALAQDPPADTITGGERDLPLEAARTLSGVFTEGSWISVDVSPDGTTVVFDLLGDLYTVPLAGGDAARLTSGMAFDAQPRYSPDGEWIVFTSDRSGGQNIWMIRADGSDTVQISEGEANRAESPEFTPDGEYVVASMGMGNFRLGGAPKLRLFHVEGGGGADLIEGDDAPKTLGAAFGADGRWIWYAQRTGGSDWTYNATLPQYAIRAYDRDTGESYDRVARYGGAFRPTLSPDGRWLVYGTRHDASTALVIRDLETGDERWLAHPVQHDDQESRATLDVLPGMSFTPDGRDLVASYGGRIWRIPVEGGAAVPVPFRASVEVGLGAEVDFDYPIEDTPTFTVQQIRDAVPSPDGSRLAFTALDRLYVSGADGSNPRRLTDMDVSEHQPTWSPDGRWIAYATWSDDGEGHLYRVPAAGGTPERLTTRSGIWVSPAWSPAGDRIVALRGYARDYLTNAGPGAAGAADDLVWIPATGGDARLVMPAGNRGAPHFVGDGDRIHLFQSPDALVSVRWDGTDEKTHLKVRGGRAPGQTTGQAPDLVRMAPLGDQAAALIQGQLYTVTVPRVGEAPTITVGNPENAAFPARRLTRFGAEFPAWSADGRSVHWSLGNAHFVYDLDAARAFEDSVAAAGPADETPADSTEAEYEPREFRIRIEARRDRPEGVLALRGARIVTMAGDEVIEDGDLVIRDNRIVAVGPRGEVEIPGDAEVLDVAGATIVPGFVDTHSHMWPAFGVHRTDLWLYHANLAYGVTTTRDPQTSRTDVLTYADRVRAGDIVGPRIYSTGPGVFFQENLRSLDEARDLMRRYAEYYDTKTLKMYVSGTRKQRQWLIQAAREHRIMPTTEGSLNLKQNLTETIDGYPGLEHSLPVYPVYDDVVRLFVETGRVYTPTLLVAYGGPWAENYWFAREQPHDDPKLRRFTPPEELDGLTRRRGAGWFMEDEHVFQDHAAFARNLVEAGGRVGVGSHGQLQGLGYHWELWSVASAGMDNHDALRVATLFGAEAIGLDRDLGSLEPGKLADLVILDGNPLVDLRATNDIRMVMVNGRLHEADTLAEVFPRERPLPLPWWWNAEPRDVPGVGR